MKSLTLIEWLLYTTCALLLLAGSVMYITYMAERNEIYMDVADCMGSDRSETAYADCFAEVERSRSHVTPHK